MAECNFLKKFFLVPYPLSFFYRYNCHLSTMKLIHYVLYAMVSFHMYTELSFDTVSKSKQVLI